MTAPTGNAAPEQHAAETPFGRLWRTRDLEAWLEHLSPDVVLHSPITATPFTGIDLARDVYAVLLSVLHDVVVSSPHTGTEGAATCGTRPPPVALPTGVTS
jgi:hypothetical protein